jgi:hypothetical protein
VFETAPRELLLWLRAGAAVLAIVVHMYRLRNEIDASGDER